MIVAIPRLRLAYRRAEMRVRVRPDWGGYRLLTLRLSRVVRVWRGRAVRRRTRVLRLGLGLLADRVTLDLRLLILIRHRRMRRGGSRHGAAGGRRRVSQSHRPRLCTSSTMVAQLRLTPTGRYPSMTVPISQGILGPSTGIRRRRSDCRWWRVRDAHGPRGFRQTRGGPVIVFVSTAGVDPVW